MEICTEQAQTQLHTLQIILDVAVRMERNSIRRKTWKEGP